MIRENARVLVIAPHPDDEVLGCGGTIKRFAEQDNQVTVAIATRGTPLFPAGQVREVRREAEEAHKLLGVDEIEYLDLPVTTLHLMAEHKLNAVFIDLIQQVQPDAVYLPFSGDRHEDHRQVFDAAMVALRPDGRKHQVQSVYCYETVSETHWAVPGMEPVFEPTCYVDISNSLQTKLDAMRAYQSQLEAGIPARSIEAIESLAKFRGSVVGVQAAEGFQVVRDLWL
jgi:LmbE family N-acetylglucosaminyl deacetylase